MLMINWNILFSNLIYASIGCMSAIIFMMIGYKILDRMTTFDTCSELEQGNGAVGRMVMGIFIAIGIVVGLIFSNVIS